jgi:hypothetical protein
LRHQHAVQRVIRPKSLGHRMYTAQNRHQLACPVSGGLAKSSVCLGSANLTAVAICNQYRVFRF